MSMVINLVEDHNIYLCEGGPVYNGGVQPTPITYLTQWKIVGNSQVHTDPYLTSWKVSGNSVVNNNTILSCGDLGQDGKYHVKISNGVTIFDISLDAPLRKVNNVADTIEFPSNTEEKALVTRNIISHFIGDCEISQQITNTNRVCRWVIATDAKKIPSSANVIHDILNTKFNVITAGQTYTCIDGVSIDSLGSVIIYTSEFTNENDANTFKEANADVEVMYEAEVPTTEFVDAPQIAVSPTDTYTSANVTPYSAFEHTENKEIWSCGEYNATDGKYHILVKPQGGSIADIALDEPLRKVNNVADSIEFPSDTEGKALVTRNLVAMTTNLTARQMDSQTKVCLTNQVFTDGVSYNWNDQTGNILCDKISTSKGLIHARSYEGICFALYSNNIWVRNGEIEQTTTAYQNFFNELGLLYIIYELATPTTELIDAPQIEEADSYTCEISQGGKAVEWSSFETNSE